MNIYRVEYASGYSKVEKSVNVLAKDAADAVANTERFIKKNSYNGEILGLSKTLAVDVQYSTKKR